MNKLLTVLVIGIMSSAAYAGGEMKEVCKDKLDKAGKPVMKDGKAVQACKKIKVHKKLEGTEIPVKK